MRKILSFISVLYTLSTIGQIVDDSTKLAYGPKTTKFIYEHQVLNNQIDYQVVDSTLSLFDRKSFVDRTGRRHQDLGSFGTAVFPIFYEPQELIGRTSGFNAYRSFSRQPEDIRYYDTKSPLIDLTAYLGGENQNIVNVDFSRNVRQGWNLGFDLHKITTDKQLGGNGQGDRQVVGTAFDIYTHYKHKKLPYQALFHLSNMNHQVAELGGVLIQDGTTNAEIFQLGNANTLIDEAQNVIEQSKWHLYHDLQIADEFQVYHIFDSYKEQNTFRDFAGGQVINGYNSYTNFYTNFYIDMDSTFERAIFSSFQNEAGLKGDLASVFYRAYLKLRTVNFNYFLLNPTGKTTEKYIGGYVRFDWRDKFSVEGNGEILQSGEFQLNGTISSNMVNISYLTKKFSVPFVYSRYFGNHYEWNNTFDPVLVNKVSGEVKLKYGAFEFVPQVSITSYDGLIYVNQNKQPDQAVSGVLISTFGGQINLGIDNKKGEGFRFENEALVTIVTGNSSSVVRVPDLFFNGRYYWKGLLFGDNVPIEIGVDAHARSSYFANAYDPVTQQFYLQDILQISGYFEADLFFNMRLDKFYAGVKWNHFDQPSNDGYYATPFFPGQPKKIDLMVRWMFFD